MRSNWCWAILLSGYSIFELSKPGLSVEGINVQQPTDSVEQAQERERAQETLIPSQVLETVHGTDLLDPTLYAKLQQMKSQLIPYLKQAMRDQKGYTRLNAGHLLLYLGEAQGTEAFISGLEHPDDPNLPRSVLVELMGMKLRSHSSSDVSPDIFSHIQPLPLRREEVFIAVVPYLQNRDEDLRKFAVEVLTNLDLPQTETAILPLLKDRDRSVRLAVVQWLATHNKDEGALNVAEELLLSREQSFGEQSVIYSLKDYIKSGNPIFIQRSVELLVRYVSQTIQHPPQPADSAIARINQAEVANQLHWALEAIAQANYPQEKQLLMAVVDSTAEDWVRGVALDRLVQLDRKATLPRLQAALSDQVLGQYAAATLAKVTRSQPDIESSLNRSAAIKTLVDRLNTEPQADALTNFLDALIALNGDVRAISPTVVERLDPFQRMQMVWVTKGLTPRKLGERLVQAGIINPLDPQQWQEIEQSWHKQGKAFNSVIELLSMAERITVFDAETVIPVDYKKLIADLMEVSHGRFQVSAVSQFEQQDTSNFSEQVQFVYRNQVYRFTPRDMGDWYDVDATLKALNEALKANGQPERFIALEPDGQFQIVVFAPDSTFREIAREFAIPLAQFPQAPL